MCVVVTDLYGGVKEGDIVKERFPLRRVANVQLILCYNAVRALQTSFHTLRWLSCEFDRHLQYSSTADRLDIALMLRLHDIIGPCNRTISSK